MSPRLSLTPRNKAQLAATFRYSVRAPARKQVVENAGTGGDRRRELKILRSTPAHSSTFLITPAHSSARVSLRIDALGGVDIS
jgi:hypothetical protein